MSSAVTSKTIRFPFVDTAASLFGYGIPGLPYQGIAVGQSALTKPSVPDPNFAPPAKFSQLVQVPKPSGGLPLKAISIASESLISACNISIGGNLDVANAHRVSVGCPLIGEFQAEFVSVATLIPIINLSASAAQWVWDGAAFASVDIAQNFSHPLVLNFWWGDALQTNIPSVRSPLHAEFTITNPNAGNAVASFVCVDGRRRIRVTAITPAATSPTIQLNQLYGFAQTISQPNFPSTATKIITGPTVIAASAPYIFEIGIGAAGLETMGFPFLGIVVTDATGSPLSTAVHVHAID